MNIKDTITSSVAKATFGMKKCSPEIFIVAGIAGSITAAILACKATTKIDDILDESKEAIESIHDAEKDPNLAESYSDKEIKKNLTVVYVHTGLKLAKLYGPSIVLGVASLSCIVASNNILKKRNLALMAAYATVDNSLKDYRKGVIERFGQEVDKELATGVRTKTVDEKTVDEKGKETVAKKDYKYFDHERYSGYARIFDETNTNYTKDPYLNMKFLHDQEHYANDKFRCQGYLFLNDVYEMLGFPLVPEGQIVGWVLNETNASYSENVIDFGIWNMHSAENVAFINGEEKAVVLDFNVDGVIYDTFPRYSRT